MGLIVNFRISACLQKKTKELATVFSSLLDEYFASGIKSDRSNDIKVPEIDLEEELRLVSSFIERPCSCFNNCQKQFTISELLESRENFRWLSLFEKNGSILSQLNTVIISSKKAQSGRQITDRKRQKFNYQINSDRPVCREVFLFYHGESIKRLKHLQKHLIEVGTLPPIHGNTGRKPSHACSVSDKIEVESFILNFAVAHGLPDPGRDLRIGKRKLRILLPAVLNYLSVHRTYEKSTPNGVGYQTFIRIWNEVAPHICFHKPRSDVCITCEDFKKSLNRVTSDLTENRDDEKIQLHREAVEHLEHAKKERDYYAKCIKISEKNLAQKDRDSRNHQRNPIFVAFQCITLGILLNKSTTHMKTSKLAQSTLKHQGEHNYLVCVVKVYPNK